MRVNVRILNMQIDICNRIMLDHEGSKQINFYIIIGYSSDAMLSNLEYVLCWLLPLLSCTFDELIFPMINFIIGKQYDNGEWKFRTMLR